MESNSVQAALSDPVNTSQDIESEDRLAQSNSNQAQQMTQVPQEILGAVKVRDGLFLGDEYSSQDLEFVIANKVTHIINCAGRQVFNQWTPVGVKYLTFYWLDDDRQLIFDDSDQVAKEIHDFIEEAFSDYSGVLVHSVRGQSRACCVLSIYLMMKFKWTLLKALEFINSRRPNLELRASFLQQLSQWERRTKSIYPKRSDHWEVLFHDAPEVTDDELLLRNTFVNAQLQQVNHLQQWKEDVLISISSQRQKAKIRWGDNGDDNQKFKLIREASSEDLINKEDSQITQITIHRNQTPGKPLLKKQKSIHLEGPKPDLKAEPTLEKQPSIKSIQQQATVSLQSDIAEDPFPEIQALDSIGLADLTQTKEVSEASVPKEVISQLVAEQFKQTPVRKSRKRPATPLLRKNSNSTDLLLTSPRSGVVLHSEERQQPKTKRTTSSKRLESDDAKEKKDKFKAKVAWAVSSPKEQNILLQKGLKEHLEHSARNIAQSPSKVITNTNILKKELLEKAKQALAANSKVTVGVDVKKIQETLNKTSQALPAAQNAILSKASGANIINNNNINNFYIQTASVIEIPKVLPDSSTLPLNTDIKQPSQQLQPTKVQGVIGQHHHKRTNSAQSNFSNQLKNSLGLQKPQPQHRKLQSNDLTVKPAAKFLVSEEAPSLLLDQNQKGASTQSKKDFKQMILDLQKDRLSSFSNFQNLQYSKQSGSYGEIRPKPEFQRKPLSSTSSQVFNQISKGYYLPQSSVKSVKAKASQSNYAAQLGIFNNTQDISRLSSSQQLITNQFSQQKSSSVNRNRKLRRSNDQILQRQKDSRRAQTPMPISPISTAIQQNQFVFDQTARAKDLANSSTSLMMQSMPMFYPAPSLKNERRPSSVSKKRTKSPISSTLKNRLSSSNVNQLLASNAQDLKQLADKMKRGNLSPQRMVANVLRASNY